MTVVLITISEIHIKNETLSLFKTGSLRKDGGVGEDYKQPGNTHAVASPHQPPAQVKPPDSRTR